MHFSNNQTRFLAVDRGDDYKDGSYVASGFHELTGRSLQKSSQANLQATSATLDIEKMYEWPRDVRNIGPVAPLFGKHEAESCLPQGRTNVVKLNVAVVADTSKAAGKVQAAQDVHADDRATESRAIDANVGFIGAGNMGSAILQGWIASGIADPERLAACVRSDEAAEQWRQAGMKVCGDALEDGAAECAKFSDIIFLGVKPQYLTPILEALAPHITKKHTIVSIAAGWTIKQLEALLPPGTPVIRVMPNTPILVGQGASGYCVGSHTSREDVVTVHALLEACGLAMKIDEAMMDALTAVSGSGPATMYLLLEAMSDGGVAAGLPRSKALALAAQTMKGAAEMVLNSSEDGSLSHPGMLKDQVTSPAGTTIESVAALEEGGLRKTVIAAVRAAADKSSKMSQGR